MTRSHAERLLRAAGFGEYQIRRLIDERSEPNDELIVAVTEIKLQGAASNG